MEEKKRRPRVIRTDVDNPLQEREETNDHTEFNATQNEQSDYRSYDQPERKSSWQDTNQDNQEGGYQPRPRTEYNNYERRPYQDRSGGGYQDRNSGSGGYERRPYQDRSGGGYQDRNAGGGYERKPYQNRSGGYQDRNSGGSGYERKPYQDRSSGEYTPRPRQDYQSGGENYERRPYQDRSSGGGGYERRPYQDRSGGGGYQDRNSGGGGYERRPYQDRSGGGGYQDRNSGGGGYERRPYQDRSGGGGYQDRNSGGGGYERRPYQDRSGGGSYQDRNSGGGGYERRPYQDRSGGGGYQDRNSGGGGYERRPYQDRSGGGGYQDRNSGGGGYERRPYQDRSGGGYQGGSRGPSRFPKKKPFKKQNDFYVEKMPKPDLPTGEGMPLNKYLAHCGIASRRKAVEFIENGMVTVNGTVITEPYYRYQMGDHVTCEGKDVAIQERQIYVLLNKPKGVITTTDDEKGRFTVMDIVDPHFPERIYPVGRLDRETTGLILLTNDGELAQKLTHPSYHAQKQYRIGLSHGLTQEDYDRIMAGVELEDGVVEVNWIRFAEDHPEQDVVELEITSGRNRVVRRLFESLGYEVKRLDRFYFAGLTKKGLQRGGFRELTQREVLLIKHFTGQPGGPKPFEGAFPDDEVDELSDVEDDFYDDDNEA
jgi:23S rRNA pseudouridine2605 synthase